MNPRPTPRVRWSNMIFRVLLPAVLLLGSTAAAQSRVSGVVAARDGASAMQTVADAYVVARIGEHAQQTAAVTQTDSQGRYTLEGLPEGRVTLSVEAEGYYVASAGGVESASIARTCPADGECPRTDFELAKAGVVEVWVADPFGDPIQGVEVQLRSAEQAQGGLSSGMAFRQRGSRYTDDRGYFRTWGLPPGRYEVAAADQRARFGAGAPGVLARQTLEVPPGGDDAEIRFSIDPYLENYTVAGKVVGLPEGGGPFLVDVRRSASSSPFHMNMMLRDGKFQTPQLSPGVYQFRLIIPARGQRDVRLLGELDVSSNLGDVELTPQPPTGVRGRIVFQDSAPGNVGLRLRSGEGPAVRFELLRPGPDHAFDHGGIAPGRWTLEVMGGHYLVEPITFDISPGQMAELEVVVSSQYAEVSGTARLQEGETVQAAAQFIVGVRGPRGSFRMQADDEGRFFFEKLIPGEYRIAAWSRQDVDIDSDAVWDQAGENVKTFTVEPGFEVDLDLTVTP